MQEKLIQIAEKLSENPKHYLWVKNTDNGYVIDRNVTQELLDSSFSKDLSIYLNSLKQRSVEKVSIQLRKRNGSGSLKVGEELEVTLNASPVPAKKEMLQQQNQNSFGLNGEIPGLGFPQIMEGYAAKERVPELKAEIEKIKSEFAAKVHKLEGQLEEETSKKKSFKDKYQEFKQKASNQELREELFANKEPSKADKFFDALITNPEMLPQMANAFKSLTGGLNGTPQEQTEGEPQPQQNPFANLSKVKQEVIATISNEKMPEGIAEVIYKVLKRYSLNDTDFVELLIDLLNEPTLKTVADA